MITLQSNLFEGDGKLTQIFGANPQDYAKFGLSGHNGIDYGIPNGTPVYSCIYGLVKEATSDPTGYGNYVKIENYYCGVLYGHFRDFSVKVGEWIKPGQLLGHSNNTGNSTGPHLHFAVYPIPRNRQNGFNGFIDPLNKTLVSWVSKLALSYAPKAYVDTLAMSTTTDEVKSLKSLNTELQTQITTIGKKYDNLLAKIKKLAQEG